MDYDYAGGIKRGDGKSFRCASTANMLEGLASVDWASVKHAYGPATDVPDQIRALASQDAITRESAIYQLYGNIFHQGTRYEATPHAIPFLFELLKERTVQDKHEIIALLTALAIGYDEEYLPDGIDPQAYRQQLSSEENRLTRESETDYRKFGISADALIECYDAVLTRTAVLIEMLSARNEETRTAAAHALAWFPEIASESLPPLRKLVEQSASAVEKATAIIASGLIARHAPYLVDLEYLAPYLDEGQPPLVRTAAAIALAGDELTPEVTQVLTGMLQLPERVLEQTERIRFNEGKIRGLVCLVLSKHGRAQRDRVVRELCEVLKRADQYETIDITTAILPLIEDTQGRSLQEVGFAKLDKTQKLALNAIADCDGWSSRGGFANFEFLLREARLPSTTDEMYRFLGRDSEASPVSRQQIMPRSKPWWRIW